MSTATYTMRKFEGKAGVWQRYELDLDTYGLSRQPRI